MRLQVPIVRIFAPKAAAVKWELIIRKQFLALYMFPLRNCCSFEEPNSEFHFACNKLPVGGPPTEAQDGGRALLGPFARVTWRVKSDEPKD